MARAAELLDQDLFNPQTDALEPTVVGDNPKQTEPQAHQDMAADLQPPEPLPEDTKAVGKTPGLARLNKLGKIVLQEPADKHVHRRRNTARPWWGMKKEQSCSSCGSGENRMGMSLRVADCSHCGGHGPTSQSRANKLAA